MAKFKEQVSQLLDREIDRKQFLKYSAAVFLAAFGVSGMIQAILSSDKFLDNKSTTTKKSSFGYGSSRYNQ